jgi:ectoine hydroxylase-related dioxygenase (phytanoyl-CoA dioxygenase family)
MLRISPNAQQSNNSLNPASRQRGFHDASSRCKFNRRVFEKPTRMQDWFNIIGMGCELTASALQDLRDVGFVVIPGPVAQDRLAQLAAAYDAAVASASSDDVGIGRTTIRVHDFVNRGSMFDELYVYQAVLEACCRIIEQPFKLSTMLARTVRPRAQAQALHVDFERDKDGWTMVGFIFMVDEFRSDNGATRLIQGSHNWSTVPDKLMDDPLADYENQIVACGSAGSIIVYNGSVWHGHTANSSDEPRRSIQGAYIRHEALSGVNLPERMRPDTLARIGSLARYVLAV